MHINIGSKFAKY